MLTIQRGPAFSSAPLELRVLSLAFWDMPSQRWMVLVAMRDGGGCKWSAPGVEHSAEAL
jgi:hypothetical protein